MLNRRIKLFPLFIAIMFLLTACGEQGENSSKNNSKNEEILNSSSVILSPDGLDSSDPDVVVSSKVSSGNETVKTEVNKENSSAGSSSDLPIIDENLPYIAFPKIPLDKVSSAVIECTIQRDKNVDTLTKEEAQMLIKYFNDCEFKMTKYTSNYKHMTVGGSVKYITFYYDDGTKVDIKDNDGLFSISTVSGRRYTIKNRFWEEFAQFMLGTSVNAVWHDGYERPAEYVEPELTSGLAYATSNAEATKVFPQISAVNLESVTVLTRANSPNPTRISLNQDQIILLVNSLTIPDQFVATDIKSSDFNYDYGDYYRIIFEYKDGTKVQISYDGFVHTSLSSTYFRGYALGNILTQKLKIKLYPYQLS